MNKIEQAIHNIRLAHEYAQRGGGNVNVCYSGGKDSDVILRLTQLANVPYKVTHNLTTLDSPETIKHIMKVKKQCEQDLMCIYFKIIRPKKTFSELILEKRLPPLRTTRYCCQYLKENNNGDYGDILIFGVRSEESVKRKDRKLWLMQKGHRNLNSCEFEMLYTEQFYNKNQKIAQNSIVNWTLEDVRQFVKEQNIELNPTYDKGLERRVGCLFCTMATQRNNVDDIINYPAQWKRIKQNLIDIAFMRGYTEQEKYYFIVFMFLAANNKPLNDYIMTLSQEEQVLYYYAVLANIDNKRKQGNSASIIVQYFQDFTFHYGIQNYIAWEKSHDETLKRCASCGQNRAITPELKALNLKMFGRMLKQNQYKCFDCLAKELNTTREELREKIEDFKTQGCELF